MSSQKKMDRANFGPGLVEIISGATISLVLGALLAAVYLSVKPAEKVKSIPDEPVPGTVYYIEGGRNGSRAQQWMRKKQLIVEGQAADLALTEDELNALVASVVPKQKDEEGSPAFLSVESVNFRVQDDVMQIGAACTLHIFGYSQEMILQARGKFEKTGERFRYVPQEVQLGSLSADRIPGLASLLFGRAWAARTVPEELTMAWSRLTEASVVGDELRLKLP